MKENQLKEVMSNVHIKHEMEEEIMKNVKNAEQNEQHSNRKTNKKSTSLPRGLVAAAASAVILCAGGLTAYALVKFPVKERMESMPEEQIETIINEIDSQTIDASTYSRELTQEEKERRKELTLQYQQGTFPEGELKKVEDESQVDSDILCYVSSTAYFYLPDRALTDEELLQIIDYNEKANYSLQKRYEEEYADEVQAKKKSEDKLKQENQENGGITETEAIALAEEWLNKLFGLTPAGMELNYYVESAEETYVLSSDGSPVYYVNYGIQGFDYYYFAISGNGNLLSVTHSGGYLLDAEEVSLTEAEGRIETLYQSAETYLSNTFGITEDFEEVYCSYSKNSAGDGVDLNLMNFYFVKADGIAHQVSFSCENMELYTYEIRNYTDVTANTSASRIEVKLK